MAKCKFKPNDKVQYTGDKDDHFLGGSLYVVFDVRLNGYISLNDRPNVFCNWDNFEIVEEYIEEEEEGTKNDKCEDSDPKAERKCVQIQAIYVPFDEQKDARETIRHRGHIVVIRLYDNGNITEQRRNGITSEWRKEYEIPHGGNINNS